jgi:hypothetical protein
MAGPLSNPSPSQYEDAYPEGPVTRPADGTKTREAVQEFLGRKGTQQRPAETEQPRHPDTGRWK